MNATIVVNSKSIERSETFSLAGATINLETFCDARQAEKWFERLHAEVAWERHRIKLFGRDIDVPRLSCWVGDPDAIYTYSRTRFVPRAWTPALRTLRNDLQRRMQTSFNSVLCNLYRDNHDAMGWHSDDEPELGECPVIASLSFGATRRFRLRHRTDASKKLHIDLPSGSLLVMSGDTQKNYRHDLPRTRVACGPRINLTFRRIVTR